MVDSDPMLLAARPVPRRRRGSASGWSVLAVLALIAALGAWLVGLRKDVVAGEFARIETTRVRLDTGPGWVDERWRDELSWYLSETPDLQADDRDGIELLAGRLSALSFVESVGEVRVLWPDGLRIDLQLREPVACVHLGRHFLGVAADGTLLSGRWPTPPARDAGFLPVIALGRASERSQARRLVPGEKLAEPAALDGLAVAVSMWRDLPTEDQVRLGRCVIDARRARFASVEEPGTLLQLEGRRTILFGRSPNLDEPGELPAPTKWEHVGRALRLLEGDAERDEAPHGLDWDLVDVRWDKPDLHLRDAEPGSAQSEGER